MKIKNQNVIRYQLDDTVFVVDSFSPYEGSIGKIVQADPVKLRYMVEFSSGHRDSFWYNQIAFYRHRDDLEAMIDLALSLGPAAKDMFNDWVIELKNKS